MNFEDLITVDSSSDDESEVKVTVEFSSAKGSSRDNEKINRILGVVESSIKLPARSKIKSVNFVNSRGPVRLDQVDLKRQQIRQMTTTVLERPPKPAALSEIKKLAR